MRASRAALAMFPRCDPSCQVESTVVMLSSLTRKASSTSQVTIPRPNAWTASFPARLDSGKDGSSSADPLHNQGNGSGSGGSGRGGGFAATGGGCSNPATDGVYVYVWDPASKRVHKASMVTPVCWPVLRVQHVHILDTSGLPVVTGCVV